MKKRALSMEMNIVKMEGLKQNMNIIVDQPTISPRKIVVAAGRTEVYSIGLLPFN